jgi:hypothetical protein
MKNTTKQVWIESFVDEPLQHEYDVFITQNEDGYDTYTLKDTGTEEERCSLIDDENKMIVNLENKTIELDYSEAEQLLALLSISYDTFMEIKESFTISSINKGMELEMDNILIKFDDDDEEEDDDEDDLESDEDDDDNAVLA